MIWKRKSKEADPPPKSRRVCPICLSVYTDDSIYCKLDGQKLGLDDLAVTDRKKQIECPNCGFFLTTVRQRCPVCGHIFRDVMENDVKAFINLIPESGLPIRIESFPYTFGRKDVIRHRFSEYVNTEHIIFTKEADKFFVREKKSLNGTSLNGHAIGGRKFESMKKLQLADGDEIGLALDRNSMPLIRFKVEVPQNLTVSQVAPKIGRSGKT